MVKRQPSVRDAQIRRRLPCKLETSKARAAARAVFHIKSLWKCQKFKLNYLENVLMKLHEDFATAATSMGYFYTVTASHFGTQPPLTGT